MQQWYTTAGGTVQQWRVLAKRVMCSPVWQFHCVNAACLWYSLLLPLLLLAHALSGNANGAQRVRRTPPAASAACDACLPSSLADRWSCLTSMGTTSRFPGLME